MEKAEKEKYRVELSFQEQSTVFDTEPGEILMDAARRQKIYLANYCQQGGCGACTSKLVRGVVEYIRQAKGAPQQPLEGDLIRPCSCYALSDLELEPQAAWKDAT